MGRDESKTPSFYAVLAWCVGCGVPRCSLPYEGQRALDVLLATALSDTGYQTVRAILNSHRIIGELEELADDTIIGDAAKMCPNLLARSVFDIPLECLPNGNPAPPYVAVGGNTPSNTKGKDVIQWEWPGGVPGLSKRRQQFCDHAVAVLGTP